MTATRLRWLASIYAGGTPAKDVPAYWQNGTIPWLNSGAVNDWAITKPSALISAEGYRNSSAKWIPKGAVVVALAGQGKTKGMAARLEFASTCNQSMAAIVPGDRLNYRYLHLTLAGRYQEIRNMSGGDQREGLNLQHVGDITLPVLPIDEQRRIADFLDDQVARIDNIIATRTAMIDCLEGSRGDLLPSILGGGAAQWLGRSAAAVRSILPNGWAVAELGHVLRQLTNGYVGPTRGILVDAGIPYIQSLHIKAGRINFQRHPYFVTQEWHDTRPRIALKPRDILIVQTGDIGQVVLVPDDIGPASCHALLIARVNPKVVDAEYVAEYLRSSLGQQELLARATGALHPHLESGIKSVPIVIPPPPVRASVVDQLRQLESARTRLLEATARVRGRLEELKRSLITAAVTGEFDVAAADGSRVPT